MTPSEPLDIEAIRKRHTSHYGGKGNKQWCYHCGASWPCDAIRLCDELDRLREALESMVWQHAYRIDHKGSPALSTGGLSANGEAFDALGWDDPYPCPEMTCEVADCQKWNESGVRWGDLYLRLCRRHTGEAWAGKAERPPVRESALKREALRDKDGKLPIDWDAALSGEGGAE